MNLPDSSQDTDSIDWEIYYPPPPQNLQSLVPDFVPEEDNTVHPGTSQPVAAFGELPFVNVNDVLSQQRFHYGLPHQGAPPFTTTEGGTEALASRRSINLETDDAHEIAVPSGDESGRERPSRNETASCSSVSNVSNNCKMVNNSQKDKGQKRKSTGSGPDSTGGKGKRQKKVVTISPEERERKKKKLEKERIRSAENREKDRALKASLRQQIADLEMRYDLLTDCTEASASEHQRIVQALQNRIMHLLGLLCSLGYLGPF